MASDVCESFQVGLLFPVFNYKEALSCDQKSVFSFVLL